MLVLLRFAKGSKLTHDFSSTIITALDPSTTALSDTALAYFYFDFNEAEKQHVDECICSLIIQLAQFDTEAAEKVQALHIQCENGGRRPSSESLRLCLGRILKDSPRTFLVLDALDECTEGDELLETIERIRSWNLPNVNILATSRKE